MNYLTHRVTTLAGALALSFALLGGGNSVRADAALVLQSDFGNKDVAVASMKGVAYGVSRKLDIFDLTHEIPTFNIWEASLRLAEVADYWPPGTVFVSVVDPGVGTERKSVVLRTKQGHYYVTPDNGSLTAVAEKYGIAAVREIDEAVNRLANSEKSYTFHGRDVYAYTGARLASGEITFKQVGKKLPREVLRIPYQEAGYIEGRIVGNIEILDPQFGNIWTNIDRDVFAELELAPGDSVRVSIFEEGESVFDAVMPYHRSFGSVAFGEPLLYLNSLNKVSLALNQGNFSATHNVLSGPTWRIQLEKPSSDQ